MDSSIQQKTRLLIKQVQNKIKSAGGKSSDVRKGTLHLLCKADKTNKTVSFDLTESIFKTSNGMEILLKDKKSFFANACAIGIQRVKLAGVAPAQLELHGNSPIFYYPDPVEFGGAIVPGGTVNQAAALEGFYHSVFTQITDTNVRVVQESALDYRCVPITQQSGVAKAAYDGIPYRDPGTTVFFNGGTRNVMDFKLPNGDYSAIEGDTTTGVTYFHLFLSGAIVEYSDKYTSLLEDLAIDGATYGN